VKQLIQEIMILSRKIRSRYYHTNTRNKPAELITVFCYVPARNNVTLKVFDITGTDHKYKDTKVNDVRRPTKNV
jgi:hypothetical protein